jgi:hypothetical protein
MEQRLQAAFLRPGLMERAAALGIGAVAIGTAILLAAWGISFLWRFTPPEIAVRIANPEVRVSQSGPLTVTQDKPFVLAKPEPLKIERGELTIKVEQQSPATSGVGGDTKAATGEVINREVTVFSNVRHGPGTVVTGWNYRDGSGGVPVQQFCYYTAPNFDRSSKKVDIASNRVPLPNIDAGLVPDLEGALAKCQWWQG